MKRTTIFIEPSLESDLRAVARRQGRPVAAVVREAVARYVTEENQRGRAVGLGFVAVGRSGRRDTAARHEELLWRDVEPHGEPSGPRALKRLAAVRRPVPASGRRRKPGHS